MVDLWTLGGLRWQELARRTLRGSWEDEVYGQAARLAFYHFLALFPALLLAFSLLARLSATGSHLLHTLDVSLAAVLPPRASQMVASFLAQLNGAAARHTIWFALFGSVWAALNGTWAVMSGLNAAYEVEERRPWSRIMLTAAGLTIALALLAFTSLILLFYSWRIGGLVAQHAGIPVSEPVIWHLLQWPVVALILLVAFALLYRFGPDLPDRQMRWSTPGALIAVVLWLCASGLFRAYISYQASRYDQVYGAAGSLAILLLWFYFTGVAILIGGEANSEIENAAAQHGHPDARRPGEHREGGVTARRGSAR